MDAACADVQRRTTVRNSVIRPGTCRKRRSSDAHSQQLAPRGRAAGSRCQGSAVDKINTDTLRAGSGALYLSVNLLDPHRLQQVPHHLNPGCSLNRARAASCRHLLATPHTPATAGPSGLNSRRRRLTRPHKLAPQVRIRATSPVRTRWRLSCSPVAAFHEMERVVFLFSFHSAKHTKANWAEKIKHF